MAGLHLVFSLLFICFISCTASPRDLSMQDDEIIKFGWAKILYDKEQLCSGIHIKPWIVLTVADCVSGLDVNRLEAGVTKDGIPNVFTIVLVDSVTIHDKYKKGEPENNFALLDIYAMKEWNVYEFQFTSHFVTYDEILKNSTRDFYVNLWLPPNKDHKDYYWDWDTFGIFKNDSLCGTCEYETCYCGYYLTYCNPEYFKTDVGSPLYYVEGNEKMVFGLDTGISQTKARVLQEVYSIKSWVRDFVRFHCEPPEDKL